MRLWPHGTTHRTPWSASGVTEALCLRPCRAFGTVSRARWDRCHDCTWHQNTMILVSVRSSAARPTHHRQPHPLHQAGGGCPPASSPCLFSGHCWFSAALGVPGRCAGLRQRRRPAGPVNRLADSLTFTAKAATIFTRRVHWSRTQITVEPTIPSPMLRRHALSLYVSGLRMQQWCLVSPKDDRDSPVVRRMAGARVCQHTPVWVAGTGGVGRDQLGA